MGYVACKRHEWKEKKLPKRLTVNLDEKTEGLVERICENSNCSKAKAVRKAIKTQALLDEIDLDVNGAITIMRYFKERKNCLVPENLLHMLLSECNDCELKEDCDRLEQVEYDFLSLGKFYSKELSNMNKDTIEEYLAFFENLNWYNLMKNSKRKFTLDLKKSIFIRFVEPFVRGLLVNFSVEISSNKNFGKIRVLSD